MFCFCVCLFINLPTQKRKHQNCCFYLFRLLTRRDSTSLYSKCFSRANNNRIWPRSKHIQSSTIYCRVLILNDAPPPPTHRPLCKLLAWNLCKYTISWVITKRDYTYTSPPPPPLSRSAPTSSRRDCFNQATPPLFFPSLPGPFTCILFPQNSLYMQPLQISISPHIII